MELPYYITPTVPVADKPVLWIIGDSVTAGVGDAKTETWPRILARKHDIAVHDYSQMGATVGTAMIISARSPGAARSSFGPPSGGPPPQ